MENRPSVASGAAHSLPIPPLPLQVFISTGEVSGDLQGSLLIQALKKHAQQKGIPIHITALGGDRMAAAGATLLGNTSAIGSVGILEALPYVWPTLRLQWKTQKFLRRNPPDVVVLIDYVGANLRLGRFIRRSLPSCPLVYYIAPQEWVWSFGQRSTQTIVDLCDRILAIFPGEASYYQRHGAPVIWVGHPLVDRMQSAPSRSAARQKLGISHDQPLVALLPASRQQEIQYLMPVMFAAAQKIQAQIPEVQFVIPLSLERYREPIVRAIRQHHLQASLATEPAEVVIAAADLAIAKSGTVNLETALLQVPQVVLYRVHPFTAWIAQHILRFSIPFMSPPNLVLMEPIVPEFLQKQATPEALYDAAIALLRDSGRRDTLRKDYQRMKDALGDSGVCQRAAAAIFETMESCQSKQALMGRDRE